MRYGKKHRGPVSPRNPLVQFKYVGEELYCPYCDVVMRGRHGPYGRMNNSNEIFGYVDRADQHTNPLCRGIEASKEDWRIRSLDDFIRSLTRPSRKKGNPGPQTPPGGEVGGTAGPGGSPVEPPPPGPGGHLPKPITSLAGLTELISNAVAWQYQTSSGELVGEYLTSPLWEWKWYAACFTSELAWSSRLTNRSDGAPFPHIFVLVPELIFPDHITATMHHVIDGHHYYINYHIDCPADKWKDVLKKIKKQCLQYVNDAENSRKCKHYKPLEVIEVAGMWTMTRPQRDDKGDVRIYARTVLEETKQLLVADGFYDWLNCNRNNVE